MIDLPRLRLLLLLEVFEAVSELFHVERSDRLLRELGHHSAVQFVGRKIDRFCCGLLVRFLNLYTEIPPI